MNTTRCASPATANPRPGKLCPLSPRMEWLAPAKINLALHVTGQRADGYHLLDMLVVFACDGDRIIVSPADHDSFTVSGRFAAAVPTDERNLVIRARDALRAQAPGTATPVAIHLEKNLPIAAGIGGGSSDAAATMLALNAYWQLGLSFDTLLAIGLTLGADLPMCLHGAARGTPVLARGIGEAIQTGLPIDAKATMENIINTAKERHIVMQTDEQIAAQQAAAMAEQAGVDPSMLDAA